MIEERFRVPLAGFHLAGVLHLPPAQEPGGVVIISHGLFSSMASPKLTLLARRIAQSGLASARFDSRGCGQSGGEIADTTLSGRMEEIRAVRRTLMTHPRIKGPVVLMGSSFGGTASLVLGARQEAGGVIAWSAPSNFAPLAERWAELEEQPLGPGFIADLGGFDLPAILAGLEPVLLIHGQNDEVVPAAQAMELSRILGRSHRLFIIPRADHRLSVEGALAVALKETINWLASHHFCCYR